MPAEAPPLIVIAGPTASGKSELALELARVTGGTIINADSMQVYRELRILTARPSAAEEAAVPHRVYGVLPVRERCSAARWLGLAEGAAADGRPAILCGGTGFYIEAFLSGLSEMPDIPSGIRERAAARRAKVGAESFHAEVAARDPALAARVPPGDRQRLLRAWAMFEATGRPLSAWQTGPAADPKTAFRILLDPPREALRGRIAERFRGMVRQGALDEIRPLRGLDPELPAMKALGARELLAHLDGTIGIDEAQNLAVQATCRFAKRQRTWFSRRFRPDLTLTAGPSPDMVGDILARLSEPMLTTG